jgi:hypothetical protein
MGLLVALLALGREDEGDGMLGEMLLRTDWLAVRVAGVAALVLGFGLLAADVGILPRNARVVGLAAADWALYGAASFVALFLAALGLASWTWSGGRGTRSRKASAARNHVIAVVLAATPWTIRAFFGA